MKINEQKDRTNNPYYNMGDGQNMYEDDYSENSNPDSVCRDSKDYVYLPYYNRYYLLEK